MSRATPLLDLFRRGEVPLETRLLAAAGVLAPRADEQIAILILLSDDRDVEVRSTALRTIDQIPLEPLCAYLGRTDVPIGVREFFGNRGVFPAEIPAVSADAPLIDSIPDERAEEPSPGDDGGSAAADTMLQRVQKMGFTDRVKAAMRGTREIRAMLIRDPNKAIATAVLSSPKVTESEVESFARMSTVSEDVLRTIGSHRPWLKHYAIVVALARNPKTPLHISLHLLNRLNERDLATLSTDRNVPDPLRSAARRKVAPSSPR